MTRLKLVPRDKLIFWAGIIFLPFAVLSALVPSSTGVGIALAIASIVVMPVLFILKYRLGKSIGSKSLVADSKETLACLFLSFALLAGLTANAIWKVWWIDSTAALVIAVLIFREGYETLRESRE